MDEKLFAAILLSFGLSLLVLLSAYGCSEAIGVMGAASVSCAQKKSIIPQAYISVIFASTGFLYAFIIAMMIVLKVDDKYSLNSGYKHFGACLMYGISGFVNGKAMGMVSKPAFKTLVKVPSFFISFMLILATIEASLIMSLVMSMMTIF
ncbi:V-type proton ATPase 16 kDa proteolipid subunit [Astathelohania contejeani]|uniref:V-type proton ATPase 16 kDa proteolipid subunit n=1 Tax=Astathelohania contejeani TaxID=164912 RepID=A0ABQ7HWV3_9MICR|nr:V-type proton ATPase 16 kDa proteolipid subunit [Thelohania contejeani]